MTSRHVNPTLFVACSSLTTFW